MGKVGNGLSNRNAGSKNILDKAPAMWYFLHGKTPFQ
jgi:hypothetical protein